MKRDPIANWNRLSRFHCAALALDMASPNASQIANEVRSEHARSMLSAARKFNAAYVVMAGQLFRKKAGAFCVLLRDKNPDHLRMAMRAAHHKMTDLGEQTSLWFVHVDEPLRADLMDFLAGLSATEGNA